MGATGILVGRERELTALRGLAAQVGSSGRAVLLRGPPGVGKSALLEAIGDELSGDGWLVLRTDGTPAEQLVSFAALHKLVRPVMDLATQLFAAQRSALLRAFGLVEGPLSSGFLVGSAVLDLLAEQAARRPVLVLVDDTQWMDRASVEVLGFVARRLDSDAVLLLAAGRDGYDDPLREAGLPQLTVAELEPASSRALLTAGAAGLTAAECATVLDAAAGNPLALIELPKALRTSRSAAELFDELPMTERLERAFALRTAELSLPVGDLLLVAAINDGDSVAEMMAAAGHLHPGPGIADLDAAVAAGLVAVNGAAVRFRHPLARAAIHRSASSARLQAAHAALAVVLAGAPSRSVWHRAAAVTGPDEAIAAELEAIAMAAREREAIDVAVAAFRRSAELSSAPSQVGRRRLAAAELAFELGQTELAAELFHAAGGLELDELDRLRLAWFRELSGEQVLAGVDRVDALVELAEESRLGGDVDLALQFLSRAASRCWTSDLGTATARRVVAATDRLGGVGDLDPRRASIRAHAAPLEHGEEVIALLGRPGFTRGADLGGLHLLARAAACVGAFEKAESLCAAAAAGLREQGRLAQLAQVLGLQAWTALRRSHWDVALTAADECARLAEETRQPGLRADALAAQAMLAALRGDAGVAMRRVEDAERMSARTGSAITLALIQNARAMVAAAADRPVEAFACLWRIYEPADPAHQLMQACWAIGSLADYAVQSGHQEAAAGQLAKLEPLVASTPSHGVHVGIRYARALLADSADAEALYLDALARELGDWPFDAARVRLSYGSWLRRRRRVIDARAPLRAACDTFERLGARGWAERAQRELRASGEDSGPGTHDRWYELSPQETQIAQLVAEGLSNKEIGHRLYLSHRTVASHLYRTFPKLGVNSRAQLARVAAAADRAT